MAKLAFNVAPDNTSDATFRAWGSVVDGFFATAGWVQTADTGQINWTTVTKATTINTSQGYSIWRMNDTLQGTYPIYLKIEYGTGPAAGPIPGIWITIGSGSDGSGTITGILRTRLQSAPYLGYTSTAYTSYASGDVDRVCMLLWTQSTSAQAWMGFSIERTKNSSGITTGDGILVLTGANTSSTGFSSQYCPLTGTIPSSYAAWNSNIPYTLTTGALGNTVSMFPIKCWTPGESGPSTNFFNYVHADIPAFNIFPVSLFNGSLTSNYIALPITNGQLTSATIARGSWVTSTVGICMRYE